MVHPRGQHAMAQYCFFQNLRQLSLALYPGHQALPCIPNLIKDSPTLQDVRIDFRDPRSSWSSMGRADDLIQVFGVDEGNAQGGRIVESILILPRLQRLHLTNFAADVRRMSQIFRSHLGTLKEVVLRNGYLISAQIGEAGDGVLADMRALHLEKLALERIWPAYRLVGVLADPSQDCESWEVRSNCKAEAEAVATVGIGAAGNEEWRRWFETEDRLDAAARRDADVLFGAAVRWDEEVLLPRIKAHVLHKTDVHPFDGDGSGKL